MSPLDVVAEILLQFIYLTPLITIPLVWRYSKQNKIARVIIGLALAVVLAFIIGCIVLKIRLRNGLA